MPIALPVVFILLGLGFLVKGADWLVSGASSLARRLGVQPIVIGLTIVAFGTSMPELVVNLVSSFGGHSEIAIGNIVGSNIFNVFFILGLTSSMWPLPFSSQNAFDALVAVGAAGALFLAMFVGKRHTLERWQGAVFILAYVLYIGVLLAS